MNVSFRSGDIIVGETVVNVTVGLGRKFVLKLSGVPHGRIRWTTENDPVLDVREAPDRMSAKIVATALGTGVIYITAGLHQHRISVAVVPMNDTTGEAVKLNGAIGAESPDA